MLLEHGVSYANVGHSVQRKYFSESDEQINKREVFAQSSGLTPIVCVGETLEQRERGEADRVITRQVEQGLENTDPSNLIVYPTLSISLGIKNNEIGSIFKMEKFGIFWWRSKNYY